MGMDVLGRGNAKAYFRASVWQWRPIHCLMAEANNRFRLGISEETIQAMSFNSGDGLKTARECERLAEALAAILRETNHETFSFDGEVTGQEKELLEALSALCREGWEVKAQGHYATRREQVEEFIRFLRECGGFEVW